ncbi:holin family 2 [Paraburkholderia atlantica]|uniref:Holin family 2 n=1 Tax=Paraburkholderia atlantica TaxID=2654982 RepID=D5WMG5_PARAM|nr:holin [Paraburkholderia atlantica]ADG20411.1 holin family 2 [Paraburkholderia atlantica]
MQLNEHEKELVILFGLGAVIGLGKLMVGGEPMSLRLVVGRMIVGAGLSASAGAVLMVFQDMPPTALVGIASAFGILGQSALEAMAQKFLGKFHGKDGDAE